MILEKLKKKISVRGCALCHQAALRSDNQLQQKTKLNEEFKEQNTKMIYIFTCLQVMLKSYI